jgi:hypothetical protein
MKSWEINGVTLEYDNESHNYIADGLIIPSVTTVLEKTIFKDMYYRDVDAAAVRREITRGTEIFEDIKDYCKGTDWKTDEVRGFKFLQKKYDIVPLCNEVPILIFNNNKPIMAGRIDLLADIKGKTTLCDIKNTAHLNDYLGYQLNLYRVGLRQSYRQEVAGLAGIHLRGLTRKLVNITIDDFKVKEITERYEQSNTNGALN